MRRDENADEILDPTIEGNGYFGYEESLRIYRYLKNQVYIVNYGWKADISITNDGNNIRSDIILMLYIHNKIYIIVTFNWQKYSFEVHILSA